MTVVCTKCGKTVPDTEAAAPLEDALANGEAAKWLCMDCEGLSPERQARHRELIAAIARGEV